MMIHQWTWAAKWICPNLWEHQTFQWIRVDSDIFRFSPYLYNWFVLVSPISDTLSERTLQERLTVVEQFVCADDDRNSMCKDGGLSGVEWSGELIDMPSLFWAIFQPFLLFLLKNHDMFSWEKHVRRKNPKTVNTHSIPGILSNTQQNPRTLCFSRRNRHEQVCPSLCDYCHVDAGQMSGGWTCSDPLTAMRQVLSRLQRDRCLESTRMGRCLCRGSQLASFKVWYRQRFWMILVDGFWMLLEGSTMLKFYHSVSWPGSESMRAVSRHTQPPCWPLDFEVNASCERSSVVASLVAGDWPIRWQMSQDFLHPGM